MHLEQWSHIQRAYVCSFRDSRKITWAKPVWCPSPVPPVSTVTGQLIGAYLHMYFCMKRDQHQKNGAPSRSCPTAKRSHPERTPSGRRLITHTAVAPLFLGNRQYCVLMRLWILIYISNYEKKNSISVCSWDFGRVFSLCFVTSVAIITGDYLYAPPKCIQKRRGNPWRVIGRKTSC